MKHSEVNKYVKNVRYSPFYLFRNIWTLPSDYLLKIHKFVFSIGHQIISLKTNPTKTHKQAMPCRFRLLIQSYQINVRSLHQHI